MAQTPANPGAASCETRGESSAPKAADEAMRCAHWKRGAAAPFDQVPSGENVPITVNRRDTVREEASERAVQPSPLRSFVRS